MSASRYSPSNAVNHPPVKQSEHVRLASAAATTACLSQQKDGETIALAVMMPNDRDLSAVSASETATSETVVNDSQNDPDILNDEKDIANSILSAPI